MWGSVISDQLYARKNACLWDKEQHSYDCNYMSTTSQTSKQL